MLQPTRTKYRKAHKGRIHGRAARCNAINYGDFALKEITTAVSNTHLTLTTIREV